MARGTGLGTVPALVAAGYDWTVLDDAHFRAAAIGEDDLWGAYITDDQGQRLRVFGTEQGLRYRIPFRDVDEVIAYLRSHASEDGDRIGTMGDDGEKFGAWPTTWEHCWGARGWVDRFFAALDDNAEWLTTTTPSDWLAAHPPIGRVYVPTGSYVEMGQWALPPAESRAFGAALHAAQSDGRPEVRWLRGASWRNFQVRYREINDLHKQMLRTSDKVAAMPEGPARVLATDHLYQGQSNDCYWHGLFGGIYIAHMRLATYSHLIAAEDLADTAAGDLHAAERRDLDLDGLDDVRLATAGQVVSVDLTEGAGIGGWDIRPVRHALCAVVRRRPEAYHETLRDQESATLEAATGATGQPASIHERLALKEAGLAARLHYDGHERRSGLVRFLATATDADAWATAEAIELGDAVDGAFEIAALGLDRLVATRAATVSMPVGPAIVDVTKSIELGGDRRAPTLALTVAIHNRSAIRVEARIGLEWALMLLGGGGNPAAWWEVDGARTAHDVPGSALLISHVAQGNDFVGIALRTSVSEPATAWWAPIETVSNSEGGFERVYQGAGLLLSWPLALDPDATWTVTVTHAVATDRDLADTVEPS